MSMGIWKYKELELCLWEYRNTKYLGQFKSNGNTIPSPLYHTFCPTMTENKVQRKENRVIKEEANSTTTSHNDGTTPADIVDSVSS